MILKFLVLPAVAVALAVPVSPSSSLAHRTPAGPDEVSIQADLTPQASAPSSRVFEERRYEIFLILQGGAPSEDESLNEHLWRVAGSLAKRNWQPPRVTVEVVVAHARGGR